MKFSHFLFLSVCGAATLATSIKQRDRCITKAEADDIVSRWTSLAININETVLDETVTNDIQFFSDSQDFLEGLPYGSVTGMPSINGKQDLYNQQSAAQAPGTFVIPSHFEIIYQVFSCDTITFRWRFFATSAGNLPTSTDQPGDPIDYAGIDLLVLNHNRKIKLVYSEWNNGELLYDLGTRTCFQKNNASACT